MDYELFVFLLVKIGLTFIDDICWFRHFYLHVQVQLCSFSLFDWLSSARILLFVELHLATLWQLNRLIDLVRILYSYFLVCWLICLHRFRLFRFFCFHTCDRDGVRTMWFYILLYFFAALLVNCRRMERLSFFYWDRFIQLSSFIWLSLLLKLPLLIML